jgi:regulatory protein
MERKITALKAQKRNPNRISIFLDGEYAFGLARIVAAWLHIGQELTETKIEQLKEQDNQEVAYQRSLRFLSYRPRSEAEVRKKLEDYGYSQEVIVGVVQRLLDNRFLEDNEFARMWIENRNTFRPRSQRILKMELRQKGIENDVIEDALSETVDDEELAYEAAIRRAPRFADLDWKTFREKMSGYLGRRGFSYGTISPIVRRVWDELQSGQEHHNIEGE